MPGSDAEHGEWRRRLDQARDEVLPWIEASVPLAGLTVLEYGCGQGAVSCAVAARCGRHIGVDIDADAITLARGHAGRLGLGNIELQAAAPEAIFGEVRRHAGAVDVFLLYAVLEHMGLEERLQILQLARAVVRDGGHIVITETPNRLTPIDHHTSRMPFLHALPYGLAARYYDRSDRTEFVAAVDAAGASGGPAATREALTRWGYGMSFHELELVFGDLAAHTVASSYHPALYPGRPVRWEEIQLAATLDAWRPDLPPCWSRTWIDTILSARPVAAPAAHVRPWQPRLEHDVPGVAMQADGLLELRPGAVLPVRLPEPTDELHVGLLSAGDGATALRARTAGGPEHAPLAVASLHGVPTWQAVARLENAADVVELSLPGGGCISYVGYRGAADPALAQGRVHGW